MKSPDTVILRLNENFCTLERWLGESATADDTITQLIEDVVDCLYQQKGALSRLKAYAALQRPGAEYEQVDPEIKHPALDIERFGRDMFRQFENYGLYHHGVLPFVFTGRYSGGNLIMSRWRER